MKDYQYWLGKLKLHKSTAISFLVRGKNTSCFVKTSVTSGNTIPILNIPTSSYISLIHSVFSHNTEKRVFDVDSQAYGVEVIFDGLKEYGFKSMTLTHQPLSYGQYVTALSCHEEEEEEEETCSTYVVQANLEHEETAATSHTQYDNAVKNAEKAELEYLMLMRKAIPFQLSNKEKGRFVEFELRLEPMITHDPQLQNGGYNPWGGWWRFAE
ncbi:MULTISPECIES: hypothetical protein [Vibrio]|uniref:Uncharacterized protein n=1 Tax=Vibrio tasmaniensis TaxID=212663 RepID=A0A2N7NCN9_9VIBR|nr:hypothetical protein [Vibrio tasmaniensis]PMP09980.1 hypothetical protein BCS92_02305 [Vibrio tasmaniensis]TKG32637.1 hypothetical protein FC057_12540 [Vibrio tasmaniensis]TKG41679.1 hypothetical protein FC063_07400 [Vibrio tasmaniensis]TKG52034.1 hypothetical protein FC070_09670 [Vibrio tasmaniensis]TKG54009.1 hypothetical protein FC060_00190 [Vibrio tasmaniensis]